MYYKGEREGGERKGKEGEGRKGKRGGRGEGRDSICMKSTEDTF